MTLLHAIHSEIYSKESKKPRLKPCSQVKKFYSSTKYRLNFVTCEETFNFKPVVIRVVLLFLLLLFLPRYSAQAPSPHHIGTTPPLPRPAGNRVVGLRLKGLITVHNSSCGKVMFLHLSVILFTGRGVFPWVWGVYTHPGRHLLGRHPPPGQTHTP